MTLQELRDFLDKIDDEVYRRYADYEVVTEGFYDPYCSDLQFGGDYEIDDDKKRIKLSMSIS